MHAYPVTVPITGASESCKTCISCFGMAQNPMYFESKCISTAAVRAGSAFCVTLHVNALEPIASEVIFNSA